MIVVSVELWSAVDGERTELARMVMANDARATLENPRLGTYDGWSLVGRDRAALDKAMKAERVSKRGRVERHRRLDLHVWNLVARMLASMGYGPVADPAVKVFRDGRADLQAPESFQMRMADGSWAWVEHRPDPLTRRWPHATAEYEVWLQEPDGVAPYASAALETFDAAVRNIIDVVAAGCEPFDAATAKVRP